MHVIVDTKLRKDVRKVKSADLKKRLKKVLIQLETIESLYEYHGDLTSLSGVEHYYRIRIGDYRLILKEVDKGIELLHFRHRKEVYKDVS